MATWLTTTVPPSRAAVNVEMGIGFTHVTCHRHDPIVAVAEALLTGAPIDLELIEAEARVRILQQIREMAIEIGAAIL